MRVNFDNNELSSSISDLLKNMSDDLKKEEKTFLKKVGNVIKGKVEKNLKRSTVDKPDYKHIVEDVKATVKTNKDGLNYVAVSGGKTAYKWRFLEDGVMDEKGRQHTKATHFMQKSINDSESEIEALINEMLTKVVE